MIPGQTTVSHAALAALIFCCTFVDADRDGPLTSFGRPPHAFRPKFRYWLPDASVTPEALDADIASLAEVGAGGLELLPFYNYGQPPVSTDWSVYGFGTPTFAALFKAALNSTAVHGKAQTKGEKGMVLDFALGANQGAGVPSPAPPSSARNATKYLEEGRGLAMELVYGTAPLPVNTSTVVVPPPDIHFNYEALQNFINAPELWGDSQLVAVLAVQTVGEKTARGGHIVFLNESSVVDLTDRVENGTVAFGQPLSPGWQLMAFYQRYTNERSCVSVDNASTWIGNGSWMVDHFSAAGAQKMTDFWDTHLLADSLTKELLTHAGGYSWEDSMEMMAALWWTPDFLSNFEKRRGYSAVTKLPALFQAANLWNGYGPPYNTTYSFGQSPSDMNGGRYTDDYRLTLNEGYQDYLRHYQSWAHDTYGLDHSCQPAYNLPLDMAADAPLVGAPELESLGFGESIANYLQFTGAAHLSGRNTVSTEIGAQRIGAYAQTVPALLKLFRDSFAAGVNTLVIHGFPYSGTYPGTTWPGYTPFQFEFGEMWGPRQPAWRHLNDTLGFAARNTLALKTGVSRVDLAFYSWQVPFSAFSSRQSQTMLEMLNTAGYTHEYIGGENIVSAVANGSITGGIRDGALGPDGPAYKALVIMDQERMTPASSEALLKMAAAGLPVIIVGNAPNATIGMSGQAKLTANMAHLVDGSFPNVKVITQAEFNTSMLATSGVRPRARVDAVAGLTYRTNTVTNASQLYTHWRADNSSQKEFVYILNRGPAAAFTLAFDVAQKQAVPYALDAWTGKQSPLFLYTRNKTDGRLVVNITLSQEQSTIIAFAVDKNPTPFSVVGRSPNVVSIGRGQEGSLDVLVEDGASASLELSNGSTVAIAASPHSNTSSSSLASITLSPWSLSVESYAAPDVLATESVAANKTTLPIPIPLTKLVPWTQMKGFEKVSGVGTYMTTFSNSTDSGDILYTLHLTGPFLHTLRAFVNGVAVPPFDPTVPADGRGLEFSSGRDITALLSRDGNNSMAIEVASSLFNAVKTRQLEVRSVGLGTRVPRYYTDGKWAEFGLVGEVVVRKWRRVRVVV
ncbi:hypothetical protein Sste5346_005064 [Sporothrix stenoceras]|uniref:Secreted protein n=1 Tax=Sporothrix stenoceras TaxID=5173 RepID=A0ABR3Z5J4_9PEZI